MAGRDQPRQQAQPILLEMSQDRWRDQLGRIERWLGNVVQAQSSFRHLAEHVASQVHEPHLRQYLEETARTARRHEREIDEIYLIIGRRRGQAPRLRGAAMGLARRLTADVQGRLGGAAGPWRYLEQLLVASRKAVGAVAVTEQLGLALGYDKIVDITFGMANEKRVDELRIQEFVLELATQAILYDDSTDTAPQGRSNSLP
jgi:hypothetical protein